LSPCITITTYSIEANTTRRVLLPTVHLLDGQVMTFHDAVRVLRTRWLTVAVVAVLATLIATAWAFLATPEYSASTRIFIAAPEAAGPEEAYAASRFSQSRTIAYAELIEGEALATRTVTRLHLNTAPRDLAQKVSASANPESVVLKLSVADVSPDEAVSLANALSDDFVRMVQDLETPGDGGVPAARAVVVQPAVDAKWLSPDRPKIIGFGLIAGLLLGGVAALLRGVPKGKNETPDDDVDAEAVGLLDPPIGAPLEDCAH
jgi:capsular polysaccharide biosynthesis protein